MSYVRQRMLWLYCMMLCGCYASYPSGWVPLESGQQDCLSIGGVYHNRGGWSRSTGDAYLAPRLFQDINDKALFEGVDRVEVAVTEHGTLEVTALDRDRVVKKKQFFANKGEYRCNGGKIQIPYFTASTVGSVAVMTAANGSLTLAQATDRALVVEDSAVAMGLALFVIPVPIAGSEWTRFMPYTSVKPDLLPHPSY